MRILSRFSRCSSALAFAPAIWACNSTSDGTIALTFGGETDTLTRAPAPVSLVVEVVDLDGGASPLATVALPATSADLGSLPADRVGAVRVTGRDGAGATRVWGMTLPVEFGALSGGSLDVFVQRTGEMARMPGALLDGREAPIALPLAGRYLVMAGGADPALRRTALLYDLLHFTSLPSPTLPREAKSLAVTSTVLLAIDGSGASFLNLSDATSGDIPAPAGTSYGDVAGGVTVSSPDGVSFVVGPTRTDAPSSRVLVVDAAGSLSFFSLASIRTGAGATYVPGHGLVLFGGDAKAPAIEVVARGATVGTSLPLPPQPATASAGAALDADRVVFGWANGNRGSFVTYDLAHPDPAVVPSTATLPCAVNHLEAQALDTKTVLFVGESGQSCAFTWDGSNVTEVPFKIARRGARTARLPNGAVAIVGGSATLESFAAP